MQHGARVFLAFLIAPAIIPVGMVLRFVPTMPDSGFLALVFGLSALLSYSVCLFFGVLAYFTLKRLGITSLAAMAVMGTGLVAIMVALVVVKMLLHRNWSAAPGFGLRDILDGLDLLWPSLVLGPVAGVVIWTIARPDRDTLVSPAS